MNNSTCYCGTLCLSSDTSKIRLSKYDQFQVFEMLSSFSSISFKGTLSNVKGSTIFSPIVSVSSRLKFWKTNPSSWRRKTANFSLRNVINSSFFLKCYRAFHPFLFKGTLSNVKGSTIFSPIVSVSSRLKFWKTNPSSWRRKTANFSLRNVCGFPLITTSPAVGESMVEITFKT